MKVLDQIWCILVYIIHEEKMLYPARWKKITVDQSKVLKNLLYKKFFIGPPGIDLSKLGNLSTMDYRNWPWKRGGGEGVIHCMLVPNYQLLPMFHAQNVFLQNKTISTMYMYNRDAN